MNDDGTGSFNVMISVGEDSVGEADAMPPQIQVKYLLAPFVTGSEKDRITITWANQATHTYSTTAVIKPVATEMVHPTMLAYSNGLTFTDTNKGY
ncbi:hypothetical protein BD310DRAFT_976191 [Dichomitus squalens]|uniref:Uncharacterized protein n=1 Tax=Dichomitus squalens TaxID=114155 RepID=A0A4Q9PZ08_9APHY|nr:hypothetical protein BD310DRAFT_976191 [Dichomitus squalens]